MPAEPAAPAGRMTSAERVAPSHLARTRVSFLAAAVLAFCSDLISKNFVGEWVAAHGGEIVFVPGWFQFEFRFNQGGLFSLGAGYGPTMNVVLATVSIIVATGIFAWAWWGLHGHERSYAIVFGLILGSAAGNFLDRIRFGGVRDFIHVHYYDVYHYPTFNLADSFLVCSACYLVITSIFFQPKPDDAAPPLTPAGGAGDAK